MLLHEGRAETLQALDDQVGGVVTKLKKWERWRTPTTSAVRSSQKFVYSSQEVSKTVKMRRTATRYSLGFHRVLVLMTVCTRIRVCASEKRQTRREAGRKATGLL